MLNRRSHLLSTMTLSSVLLISGCAGAPADEGWPVKVVTIEQLRPQTPIRATVPLKSSTEQLPAGRALVQVHVDDHGRVRRAVVVESSGVSRLDTAAIDSIKVTRFDPYVENGVALPVTAIVPVQFPAVSGRKRPFP